MKLRKVNSSTVLITAGFLALFSLGFFLQSSSSRSVPGSSIKDGFDYDLSAKKEIQKLEKKIDDYLDKNDIDSSQIAYVITDLDHKVSITLNEDEDWFAASTYKLPLAMLYYDMAGKGEIDLDDPFYGSGYTTYEDLIETTIVDSSNSTAESLFENLGGWEKFKKLSVCYSNADLSEDFFGYENLTTAAYMNDVLRYLYSHQSQYKQLMKYLQKAQPDDYLNAVISTKAYQKYGNYDTYHNSVGLVLDVNTPYSIAIFTDSVGYGNIVIGEINEICYNFFQKEGESEEEEEIESVSDKEERSPNVKMPL